MTKGVIKPFSMQRVSTPMATNSFTPETVSVPNSDAEPSFAEGKGYLNRGAVGFEDANEALAHALQSELAGKLQLDTTQLAITITDEEITLSGAVAGAEQRSGVISLAAVMGAPRKVVDNLHVER